MSVGTVGGPGPRTQVWSQEFYLRSELGRPDSRIYADR